MKTMIRLITFLLLGAIFLTPLFADRASELMDSIEERGVLQVICQEADKAPLFSRNEDGEWSGYYIDIVRQLALELDLSLEVTIAGSRDRCIQTLEAGKADIYFPSSPENLFEGRLIRYSRPVIASPLLLGIDRLSNYKNPSALELIRKWEGVSVFLPIGSIFRFHREELPDSTEFLNVDEYETALNRFLSGEGDACITDNLNFMTAMLRDPSVLIDYRFFELDTPDEKYSMAASFENTLLISLINITIDNTSPLREDTYGR